jgi:hypothetical protein
MLHRSANAGKRQTRPPIAAHVSVHFTVPETRPESGEHNRQRYACCTHGVSLIVSIGCLHKKAIATYSLVRWSQPVGLRPAFRDNQIFRGAGVNTMDRFRRRSIHGTISGVSRQSLSDRDAIGPLHVLQPPSHPVRLEVGSQSLRHVEAPPLSRLDWFS